MAPTPPHLHEGQVHERALPGQTPSTRSVLRDVIHGSLGFALVSVAAFSIWAFAGGWLSRHGGDWALYGAIAAAFVGLSGLVLGPLAGGAARFYRGFLPAFLMYCVLWCLAWFLIKGRTGEWIAALAGSLGFAWVGLRMLGSKRGWLVPGLILFVLHSAGYFAGSWAMYGYWLDNARAADFPKLARADFLMLAKLSWGLCYGLGFGAGLGWVFHRGRR